MSRNSRDSINASFLHVMAQGINKSFIFNEEEDVKYYIKLMYKIKNEYNIRIVAYCVMNNHVHILVEIKSIESLSNYMHKLNTKYAMYYNKKHDRVGYVFRNRFKSEGIYEERYYYSCIKYIFDNPVKAGICSSPEQYPYSNYRTTLLKPASEHQFIDTKEDIMRNCNNFVSGFLKNHNISINELKNNYIIIKKLINILYDEYGLSIRNISKTIKISRNKIGHFIREKN